jgi:hypothetical protein
MLEEICVHTVAIRRRRTHIGSVERNEVEPEPRPSVLAVRRVSGFVKVPWTRAIVPALPLR